jgi:hypothetical protein
MISKRLEVVGSAAVIIAIAALVLGPGTLWAAPVPADVDQGSQFLQQIARWLTGVQSISAQDECSADPNGAQCADTLGPAPVPKTRKAAEPRKWLSLCSFVDGFGCSPQPDR